MDLSIIIVNYRTYDLTASTIDSVINTVSGIEYEIIVVDNYSNDGSYEALCDKYSGNSLVSMIENSYNGGFAVANNIGFKHSTGDYILLLNSDVILKESTVNKTLDYIKTHDDVGAVGPRVRLPDGQLDKACRRSFPTPSVSFYRLTGLSKIFPKSKRFNRYNLSYLDETKIYPVECIVGAYILTRREIYEKYPLDESYFMYGEDIEFCYNIVQSGFKVIYYGECEVTHYKGASGKNKRLLYEFYNSMGIFYTRHYKDKYNIFTNYFIYSGIWGLYYIKLLRLMLSNLF